jgi:hypothetical protein
LFDPSEAVPVPPIVAWRLPYPGARVYRPWLPEPDGSWYSQTLNVSFVPDSHILRVRGSNGRLIHTPLEYARRARRDAALCAEIELQREQDAATSAAAEARARQAEDVLRRQQEQIDAMHAELEQLRALLGRRNE